MAYCITFSARALRELGETYDWYETQNSGLGEEFMAAIELQTKRLEQAPLLYGEVVAGVRRALLPRFPYALFYTVRDDLVYVLAVLHHARDQKQWPKGKE